MRMRRSQRNRLLLVLAVSCIGALIGFFYTAIAYPRAGSDLVPAARGMRVGFLVMLASSTFEVFVMRARPGRWIKQLPLGPSLAVRLLVHTALITALLQVNIRLISLRHADFSGVYRWQDLASDAAFALLATAIILTVLQARQLIGPRTFRNLLTGRYHKPQREARIFAIFDIAGSTAIARAYR